MFKVSTCCSLFYAIVLPTGSDDVHGTGGDDVHGKRKPPDDGDDNDPKRRKIEGMK